MALILAKYDELPYDEIGTVLGISEKAVKSLVHRARESLRERLAPFLKGEIA
jgi:RNA polymerase sigma-70 factor (ECF subfamily)